MGDGGGGGLGKKGKSSRTGGGGRGREDGPRGGRGTARAPRLIRKAKPAPPVRQQGPEERAGGRAANEESLAMNNVARVGLGGFSGVFLSINLQIIPPLCRGKLVNTLLRRSLYFLSSFPPLLLYLLYILIFRE
ncbi:uncharacterized protein VTP21DRAFT_435 [Calcarisporiella thermophila]|uniref:uncharacterized protein n=1 Tax=Calcarisporiella thermophila TaxID=911321 RepID=UPI003743227C